MIRHSLAIALTVCASGAMAQVLGAGASVGVNAGSAVRSTVDAASSTGAAIRTTLPTVTAQVEGQAGAGATPATPASPATPATAGAPATAATPATPATPAPAAAERTADDSRTVQEPREARKPSTKAAGAGRADLKPGKVEAEGSLKAR